MNAEPMFNRAALKIAMARRRATATSVARAIGARPPDVRQFLLGMVEPTAEQAERIARSLSWPLAFFYDDRWSWDETMWVSGGAIHAPIISS